jgi:hypothetical protein
MAVAMAVAPWRVSERDAVGAGGTASHRRSGWNQAPGEPGQHCRGTDGGLRGAAGRWSEGARVVLRVPVPGIGLGTFATQTRKIATMSSLRTVAHWISRCGSMSGQQLANGGRGQAAVKYGA